MSHIACRLVSLPPSSQHAVILKSTYLDSLLALSLDIPPLNPLAHVLHNNRALPAIDKDTRYARQPINPDHIHQNSGSST
jgi:hypothetical protein